MKRILFALAAAAPLLYAPLAGAEPMPQPRVMVTGEGEAAIAPDLATLSLGVMREAKTAREALDANNAVMAKLIDAMKAAGVAERDLQTAAIQINPRYTYADKPDGTQEGELVAYQVTNMLSVRVRDIAKAGALIDTAVSLGVNQGAGISFGNDDPSGAITDARKKAVADAVAKARVLAEAAGVGLGRVLEITDQALMPAPMPLQAKAFDARSAAVPIQPGESAYRVQVGVTFELVQKP